jgi:hypothetical protein
MNLKCGAGGAKYYNSYLCFYVSYIQSVYTFLGHPVYHLRDEQ